MQNNVHMRPFLCKNETENIFWEYHDKCLMSPIWIFPDVYRCLTVSQCIVTFPLLPHSSYLLLGLLLKQFSIKENCVLTLLNVGESMKFVTYFTNGQTKKCCWEVFLWRLEFISTLRTFYWNLLKPCVRKHLYTSSSEQYSFGVVFLAIWYVSTLLFWLSFWSPPNPDRNICLFSG